MPIPILLISINFFFLIGISSVLETHQIILSFFGFFVKNQINLQSNN